MSGYVRFSVKDMKMPHGKVADTRLPPDWRLYVGDNLSEFKLQENGDTVADGPFGSPLSITTVPPRLPGELDDPDGHTEFHYLSETTRNKVFSVPGFPAPLIKPKTPRHEVREAPGGKGLGVFATCDMYPGDLIWSERPYIVKATTTIPPKGTHIGTHHSYSQANALRLYASERVIEAIYDRLTPERQEGFKSLANSHKEDGSGPLTGIIRTNQLEIRMREGDPDDEDDEDYNPYAAIAVDLSRTNHSCVPNINYSFDFASFSLRIYAWGRIRKGDELVWNYVSSSANTEDRQKALSPYGFRCGCWVCKASPKDPKVDEKWESHLKRCYTFGKLVAVGFLHEDVGTGKKYRHMTPQEKEFRRMQYTGYAEEMEDLQKEGDSYGNSAEIYVLCLLHEAYKRLGNRKKMARTAIMIKRWWKCLEIELLPSL